MNILNLPKDIRELAEKRRSEQPDYCVQKQKQYPDILNYAFDWYKTPEGTDFWDSINDGNFQPYHDKYPNHEWREVVFERGEEVEVSDYEEDDTWETRIFLTEIKGARFPFVTVRSDEENKFKSGGLFSTTVWKRCRKLIKPTTISKEEATKIVAEKLNLPADKVVIE